MSQLETITPTNSTTGAGVIDSWHSVAIAVDDIKTAHGSDKAAVGVELGIVAAGAVLDTVAFALDPFAKVIAAGLGWMIEHISFLRWPLDQVAGDPDQIKLVAESLHKIGEDLRNAAADMDSTLKATVTQWQGAGFDSFNSEMAGHRTHIDDAGHAVDTAGYVVETTMALIAAVRALIRDIVTTVLGDIISTMLIALAMAVITFGASIPAGVAKCVTEGTIQGTEMAAKLAKVAAFARRTADRLKALAGKTRAESAATHSSPPSSAHSMDTITPASTHSYEPPTGTPSSVHPTESHDSAPPSTHSNEQPEGAPPSTHSNEQPEGAPPSTHSGDEDPFATWLAADQHFNAPGNSHSQPEPAPSVHSNPEPAPSVHSNPEPAPSVHSNPAEEAPGTPGSHEEPGTPDSGSTHQSEAEPPPATTNNTPEPKSYLKDQEIAKLKTHEAWLKGNFKDSWAKVKFVDDWVKKNKPEMYPIVKAMSDAKSSKNWVGWVGKDIVNVDKQLTDIQQQAEAAWQESDARWREEHPDPAAGGADSKA